MLVDLDRFKEVNDTFGHPAGDALLARVGSKLAWASAARGRAYRLGGDEFCLLVRDDGSARELVATASASVAERGEHFAIAASAGVVSLPGEAGSWDTAMHLADTRLYERKRGRPSAGRQIRVALLSVLAERDASLDGHVHEVADLAEELGGMLGLDREALEELKAAAELHDIGKIAIPDSILFKPGPLDAEELSYMQRHTLIGERIVRAVPSLARVGPVIRSSHERWDGAGYPDRLSREEIPLASRIIAVCDAFTAMTEGRPYRDPIQVEQALAELRRCARTQFDPQVVAAFPSALAAVQARDVMVEAA
jgi:diguanylate cyclase (GGDEF)-like protein